MTRPRRRLALAATAVLAAVGMALATSPVDPAAYRPEAGPPLEGPLAPNRELSGAERIPLGSLRGPEDVDVDGEGRIYAGTEDGTIVRIEAGGRGEWTIETLASTGGRPLGIDFDAAGNLVVCDARKGLLLVSPGGEVTALARTAGGVPFGFADDVDVAADGRIYFSDASSKFGVDQYRLDLLESRPHGRLLRHDPASGETEVLGDDLYFANGIALSPDEGFVLVNETYRYRIRRHWLAGPRAGTSDLFADNLPGFPDGVSSDGRGGYWLALFTVRNPAADRLHPHPLLKRLLAVLPDPLWPKAEPYGLALHLDGEGRVTHSLHDPDGGTLREVSSAVERGGVLYLGSLYGEAIGRYALR